MATKQTLNISSTSTPALVTASYNGTDTQPYGRPLSLMVMIQATRANGSAMTAVKFQIQGSMTGSAGTWIPLLAVRAGDSAGTVAQEASLAVANNSTSYDALMTENARNFPFIQIVAKSVGANAGAGDSASAFLPAGQF